MEFDHLILDVAIKQIGELNERLKKSFKIENPRLLADKTLQVLKNIKDHQSFKEQYSAMFNQCVVLLVSYFGSSLKDIFTRCLSHGISTQDIENLRKEEIKINLAELKDISFDLSEKIGEIVTAKNDISFQDMQSIQKAFKTYFGYCPDKNKDIDNIIFSQACRHAIVHAGGEIDERLIKQLRAAPERNIKKTIGLNEKIEVNPEEIKEIGKSMTNYIKDLSNGLIKTCGKKI